MSGEANILVPTYKNNGDIKNGGSFHGINTTSNIMKLLEDGQSIVVTENQIECMHGIHSTR